jgi:protein TonB
VRKYTLLVSIVVHAACVCAALIIPIMATHAAPRPLERIRVVLAEPALPAAPRVRPLQRPRPPVSDAAPIEEPGAVTPESAPAGPAGPPRLDEQAGLHDGVPGVIDPVVSLPADEPPPPPAVKLVPLRVGGVVRPPEKVHHVNPAYPPIALAARVKGIVILEALIGEDGGVRDVRVQRSVPLLDDAAEDAVRQWRFRPTLLNGQAVPVLMTVTVSFTLD